MAVQVALEVGVHGMLVFVVGGVVRVVLVLVLVLLGGGEGGQGRSGGEDC